MKVKITHCGWNAPLTGSEFATPSGWHRYLCTAENGIVTYVNTTDYIEDGVYDLQDSDWSYDNPRWDAEAEQDCEIIEVA